MAESQDYDSATRTLSPVLNTVVFGFCVALSVFHLILVYYPALASDTIRNAIHLGGFALLAAILFPVARSVRFKASPFALSADILLGLLVMTGAVYMALAETPINDRGIRLSTLDWIAGVITILGAIELTRRVAGLIIPVLIVLALTYLGWWGQFVGGVFSFRTLSWESVVLRSFYGDESMFGMIASISSSTVFIFIIFGAFLVRSGAGEFVVDLARSVAGGWSGGPGIVAVIASMLTGTISGSAVANTASTGTITIPLMKRAGFPAKFAGGVEAAASTGGQLMPPIMGAGAFVMANLTQVPYEQIVAVAFLPALLYFLTVAFFVRMEARRLNLQPLPQSGDTLRDAFRKGGASFIIPIGVLIGLLIVGFTPSYAAIIGIGAIIVSSWLTIRPMGPRAVVEALAMGARNMVVTAVLLCAIGLLVMVISTASVGPTFSLMIESWSQGSILVAMVLIALASLILGMGLPVTVAYIVLATLSAPALAGMISDRIVIGMIADGTLPEAAKAFFMLGAPELFPLLNDAMPYAEASALVASLPLEIAAPLRDAAVPQEAAIAALLSAHMIIFWLSQDSNVTPPVALAAFTAAAIAKSPPMSTGIASWKLAKGLYIVPVLFAFTPILSGDWVAAGSVFCLAVVGTYGLAGALQGALEAPLNLIWRILVGVAGLACLWPGVIAVNIAGVLAVLLILAVNIRGQRSQGKPG